jgi:hypothetical protein
LPVLLSQILTWSWEALAMCLPSGEYATEDTQDECPVMSQILTVLSSDPLTMCLPSGEYAAERT